MGLLVSYNLVAHRSPQGQPQRIGVVQINRMLTFTGDQGRKVIEATYPEVDSRVATASLPDDFHQLPVSRQLARALPTNGMVRRLYPSELRGIRGEQRRRPMQLYTIGIDLGKTIFHLVGLTYRGRFGKLA